MSNKVELIGWYGGDEFIVAGTIENKSQVPRGFKKFSDRIKEEFKDSDIAITCSVGLVFSTPTDTVKDLVYKADIRI